MLETIREYAAEQLEESGEPRSSASTHAYFDRFVRELRRTGGGEAEEAMARLDEDWENIDARRSLADGGARKSEFAEIAAETWRYVWLYDRVREATAWMACLRGTVLAGPALRGELCRCGDRRSTSAATTRGEGALGEAVAPRGHGPASRGMGAHAPRRPHAALRPDLDAPSRVSARRALPRRAERLRPRDGLGFLGTISLCSATPAGSRYFDESIAVAERVGIPSLLGANHTLRARRPSGGGDRGGRPTEAAAAPLHLEGTAYCLEGLAAVP